MWYIKSYAKINITINPCRYEMSRLYQSKGYFTTWVYYCHWHLYPQYKVTNYDVWFATDQLLVAFLIAYVNERERVGFSSCDTACQIWKPIEVKYANLSRTHLMSLKNCREVIRALKMSYSTSLFLSKIETLQLSIKPFTANCDFNFQDITKYWFQSPCCYRFEQFKTSLWLWRSC